MDFMTAFAREFSPESTATPFPIAALRMLMAMLLGGLVGIEREVHGHNAGFRTHILISLAASLFALIALELMTLGAEDSGTRTDPIRIIEAVTAGVAFLVAGSIISSGGSVKGLTTGAGMWLAGAIGVACGTGHLSLAAIATLAAIVVLWLIKPISKSVGED